MRVLLAQPFLPDPTLGSPKSVLKLGQALAGQGVEVLYLSLADIPPRLRHPRLVIFSFPLAVARAASSLRPDIVDVSSGDAFLVNRSRSRRVRPRVMNRVLGIEHLFWSDFNESARLGEERISIRFRLWFAMRLKQVEASIRFSDGVTCLSEIDRAFILDAGWRTRQDPVFVTPPGVDAAYLDGPPSGSTRPRLFFMGTWIGRKGIQELVSAFSTVRQQIPDTEIVIAGARATPARVLSDFAVEDRDAVHVLPLSTEAALKQEMERCSLCVMPSRYEGFGMAFLEAMACGLPVIGTGTGGMPDLIEDGVNGWLIPTRNAEALASRITEGLRDRAALSAMGTRARETAGRHTWESSARATLPSYEALLERRPTTSA